MLNIAEHGGQSEQQIGNESFSFMLVGRWRCWTPLLRARRTPVLMS